MARLWPLLKDGIVTSDPSLKAASDAREQAAANQRTERPLFSSRYGFRSHLDARLRDREHFGSRHSLADDGEGCERHQLLRCACPGSQGRCVQRCCQRATQEDRLCDECRNWCVAIDGQRVYHRFIDLYGVAS